ncbi:MAG: hypothetical protein COA97_00130 [Flavobacteriales bacterium]|nr:MAG: hypothetical protein COA97_00130 [Flavobacteriales bacterium]
MFFNKLGLVAILLLAMSSNIFAQDTDEEIIIEEDLIEEEILEENEPTPVEEVSASKKITTEISGNIRGDYRFYPDDALYPNQEQEYFSAIFNPEFYISWDKGNQLIQFKGFARLNQYDNKQSHWDIRELYYQKVFKKWEFSLGAKQLYWGFTESNHLANIINQDDVLEGSDIKNKLGQPMAHLSFSPKWGIIDLMVMPYFRTLQFPGIRGRGRPPFILDNNNTVYESEMEEYNPDLAIRWSHSIKSVDLGISHFYGTSRLPFIAPIDSTNFSLVYELINQTGLELQATTGSMLWKLEAIYRISERKTIKATTIGGEYTFSNVFKSDIGILVEYTYDDRGNESINGLDDDFFFGLRLALNDKQSTAFLGGFNLDRKKGTLTYFAEANRRLGDSWKISVKTLGFENIDNTDFIYLLRNDGFIEVSLAKYF